MLSDANAVLNCEITNSGDDVDSEVELEVSDSDPEDDDEEDFELIDFDDDADDKGNELGVAEPFSNDVEVRKSGKLEAYFCITSCVFLDLDFFVF